MDFFQEHLRFPGGLARYLAVLLQQLYLQPWWGAALTTLLAWGLCGLLGKVSCARDSLAAAPVSWLPALFLLLIQAQYSIAWMEFVVGLLAALLGVVMFLAADGWRAGARAGLFLLLSVLLHCFAGGLFLCFACWCLLIELLRPQPWLPRCGLAMLCAAVGGLLPLLSSRTVFLVPLAQAYELWLPVGKGGHRLWAAMLLGFISGAVLLGRWLPSSSGAVVGKPFAIFGALRRRSPGWAAALTLLVIAIGFEMFRDPQAKLRLEVDFYSQQRQWEKVLALGAQVKDPDFAIISDINRALAQTGRLTQKMFAYPQNKGVDFWFHLHDGVDSKRLMKASDLLFDLGQINRAERMAGEALELNGYQPLVLQRLALINVLKGEPQTARLFLSRLAQTLTHRDWARRCLAELDRDPVLASNDQVRSLRPFLLRKDYVGDYGTEALLYQLMLQNHDNRLAFEYLMAHYLLSHEPDKVVRYVGQLGRLGYADIPRHYQEAILISSKLNTNQTINLHGFTIPPQTLAEFDRFNERLKYHRGDLARARQDMQEDFGQTYWFYYLFGCSGALLPPLAPASRP